MGVLKLNKDPATIKQVDYIESLMIDLGIYGTSESRKQYICEIVGRNVAAADLTKAEASRVIEQLKGWKDAKP